MKNSVLNEIKDFAVRKLQEEYGYCGVAEGDMMALINSGDKETITIKLKVEVDSEEEEEGK